MALLSLNILHACTYDIMHVVMVRKSHQQFPGVGQGPDYKGVQNPQAGRSSLYASWEDGYTSVYIYQNVSNISLRLKYLITCSFIQYCGLKKHYVLEERTLKRTPRKSLFSQFVFSKFSVFSAYFRKEIYILFALSSEVAFLCKKSSRGAREMLHS